MALMKFCPNCQSFFDGRRWIYDERLYQEIKKRKKAERELCPGCERIERKIIEGVVLLKGGFLEKHRKEALNLIHHIAEKKRAKNVTARILKLKEDEGMVTVETTERTLAEKIGKELEKAFSGDLEIHWLKKENFVRVTWYRDI